MQRLWESITPREFGIPTPEVTTPELKALDGRIRKVMTWIPGMNVRKDGTFYFVLWHGGDMKRFFAAGGDAEHVIVHFLTYDSGVINPWWNPGAFEKRVERAKEEWHGVKYLVSPDFSSWANMPVVTQLMNHYRSMVVTRDLLKAGFTVVPNICWSCPQLLKVMIDSWPCGLPLVMLDLNHVGRSGVSDSLTQRGLEYLKTHGHKRYVIYSGNEQVVKFAARSLGESANILWTPSRIRVLGEYGKAIAKLTKEKSKANGQMTSSVRASSPGSKGGAVAGTPVTGKGKLIKKAAK